MLSQLKDDIITKVSPVQIDGRWESGWCDTCGDEWVDDELDIDIHYGSGAVKTFSYDGPDAAAIQFSHILEFLIQNQGNFPSWTRLDFEKNMDDYFYDITVNKKW